jgi:hypothetical protein
LTVGQRSWRAKKGWVYVVECKDGTVEAERDDLVKLRGNSKRSREEIRTRPRGKRVNERLPGEEARVRAGTNCSRI